MRADLEAQGWIAGRTFPAQKPLIDVCQSGAGLSAGGRFARSHGGGVARPETHRYTEFAASTAA